MTIPYPKFGSIPRWYKDFVISEKIDGTNGLIAVIDDDDFSTVDMSVVPVAHTDNGKTIFAGSRNRWLQPGKQDNAGFAQWVIDHIEDAEALGNGFHYGEFYGQGIQRNYGLKEKRFALFNTHKWGENRPEAFDVVPKLWQGSGDVINLAITNVMEALEGGSILVPDFTRPEGIVIYSTETGKYWKKTLENDRVPKSVQAY